MNQIIVTGRIIPNTEKSNRNYVYQPAQGDPANGGKQSWLHCLLSTQKEGAQKDANGFYPTFIVPLKAFGPTADQINQYFGENTNIEVFGVLMMSDDYEVNGEMRKGSLYIKANKIVYGFGGKPKDETAGNSVRTAQPRTVSGTTTRSANNPTSLRQGPAQIAAPF
jgi:hypothetical protein